MHFAKYPLNRVPPNQPFVLSLNNTATAASSTIVLAVVGTSGVRAHLQAYLDGPEAIFNDLYRPLTRMFSSPVYGAEAAGGRSLRTVAVFWCPTTPALYRLAWTASTQGLGRLASYDRILLL
jgi:hypothetical protein